MIRENLDGVIWSEILEILIIILAIFLIIITLTSLWLCVYLFKTKTKLDNGEYVYSPEEMITHLKKFRKEFYLLSRGIKRSVDEQKSLLKKIDGMGRDMVQNNQDLGQQLSKQSQQSLDQYSQKEKKLSDSINSYIGDLHKQQQGINENLKRQQNTEKELHALIEDRDEKIRRFEVGYDLMVYRKYIKRFADIHAFLKSQFDKPNAHQQTKDFWSEIDHRFFKAFEESGVTVAADQPKIGSIFSKQARITDDDYDEIITNDQAKIGKIAKIIRPAYAKYDDESNFVVKAKVAVYCKTKPSQPEPEINQ